jgi:alkanesulfonate monooxygenase SsuD/methylene tetrahydromethanopterin reductase-like flavin-dependent oxidoreductase (luciferase family)
MSYVVTPDMYRQGLVKIAAAAKDCGRVFDRGFAASHLLFTRVDDTYEKALDAATLSLSTRYAMDFRKAAQRYGALGTPQDVVETIFKFQQAGVRHLILDFVGPYEERDQQIERFAAEAMPLLAGLRKG